MRGGYDSFSVTRAADLDRLDTLSYAYSCGWEAGRRAGYVEGRQAERANAERADELMWQRAVQIVHSMANLPVADYPSEGRERERERLMRGEWRSA